MVFPEPWRENDQHGEDFQTSHEHQSRQDPLDHHGQNAPRHGRADFKAQRGTDIAAATQCDGKGVGAVHSSKNHDEVGGKAQEDVSEEERHQCDLACRVDCRVIHLDGKQRLGVQHVADFVAQDLQGDDSACALESSGRASGTTAKESSSS